MNPHTPVYMRQARRRQRYIEWCILAVIVIIIAIAGRYVIGPFVYWIAEIIT
jgi:hypothetical protein